MVFHHQEICHSVACEFGELVVKFHGIVHGDSWRISGIIHGNSWQLVMLNEISLRTRGEVVVFDGGFLGDSWLKLGQFYCHKRGTFVVLPLIFSQFTPIVPCGCSEQPCDLMIWKFGR